MIAKSGIELCSVKTLPDNTMQATVFVPDSVPSGLPVDRLP